MQSGESPSREKGQSGLFRAALFGLCPRCDERSLFEAPAQIAGRCGNCGLELATLERGGRLAGLLTIIVAALLITAALLLEEHVRPSLWVHLIIWPPLTIGGVLYALRLFKTGSVYRQYELEHAQP